jgi:hypothetical protein
MALGAQAFLELALAEIDLLRDTNFIGIKTRLSNNNPELIRFRKANRVPINNHSP